MADIELVIKIDEDVYQGIINADKFCVHWGNNLLGILCTGIANGTPLPRGHGRLIDADMLIKRIVNTPSEAQNKGIPLTDQYAGSAFRQIEILGMCDIAPTIIEADKTESEVEV